MKPTGVTTFDAEVKMNETDLLHPDTEAKMNVTFHFAPDALVKTIDNEVRMKPCGQILKDGFVLISVIEDIGKRISYI